MSHQIKITGIDSNKDKFLWLDIADNNFKCNIKDNFRLNPNQIENILSNSIQKLSIDDTTNKLINNLSSNFNKLSINSCENKIKVYDTINTNDENTNDENTNNYQIDISIKQDNKFNNDQLKLVNLIYDKINDTEIVVVSGKGGSGKTYTTLNAFENLLETTQNKNICFCAPTNSVVESCKKHKKILEKCFKSVDFITTSALLGEKCVYNKDGIKEFTINNKFIKINKYDIIIIDEISMVKEDHIEYIKNNNKKSLIIILGDKNQLDPVNSKVSSILDNYNVNLIENMRCNKTDINKINEFIINSIENFDYNYFKFINEFYDLIYSLKNNKTIYVVNTLNELSDLYLELYKKNMSIIGNYKNETCDKINEKIKDKIIYKNNINCVDNYFIGQQIVFLEQYENYNTSDFDTIINIKINKFEFELIDYNIFIKNIENNNIDNKIIEDKFKKIEDYKCDNICNDFNIEDKIYYKYQKIFNYLLNVSNTTKEFKKIIKEFNNCDTIFINLITLKNYKIKVLNSKYIKSQEIIYDNIKTKINNLSKNIIKSKTLKIKKFYNDFIIQTLYYLLDKYRNDIFAKISCAFSCTIHRLQGCSINNMFVNIEDIFKMNEQINKLKCLYTATSRASEILVIYAPNKPVCECGVFVKEIYDNNEHINILMCKNKKKCGFFEDKCINNSNCKKCNNCSKIFYKNMIKNNICYLCM